MQEDFFLEITRFPQSTDQESTQLNAELTFVSLLTANLHICKMIAYLGLVQVTNKFCLSQITR